VSVQDKAPSRRRPNRSRRGSARARSSEPSKADLWFAKQMVGASDRLRLYKKIAGLVRNGVSLQQALDVLYDQASKGGRKKTHPVAIAVNAWRRQYMDGKPFGEALRAWAPATECMLIEAGEAGSRLDEALESVIKLATNSKRIKGALIGGLSYPIFLILMLGGVLFLFSETVIPTFVEAAPQMPPSLWEGPGQIMYQVGEFSKNYLVFVALGAIVALIVFFITAPRWTGGVRKRLDGFPPWSLYRLINGSGFLMASAALISAGVAVPEVMRRLRRTANPWMKERIDAALREINQGANFGEALHRIGYGFPDQEVVDDLRIYANLAQFDETLASVADEWIVEGVERVQGQTKVIFSASLLLLGVTIIVMVSGMFSVQQQLTSSL